MDCPVSCEHRALLPNKRIINGPSLAAGLSCSITPGSGLLFYRQMQRTEAMRSTRQQQDNTEAPSIKVIFLFSWKTFKHQVSKSRSVGKCIHAICVAKIPSLFISKCDEIKHLLEVWLIHKGKYANIISHLFKSAQLIKNSDSLSKLNQIGAALLPMCK